MTTKRLFVTFPSCNTQMEAFPQYVCNMWPNPAVQGTLRDKAAQRP